MCGTPCVSTVPGPAPDPIDDPPDYLESEALKDFIPRLEAFSGTQRVRVPKEFIDDQGNILLPPTAAYLLDEDGGLHPAVSTNGTLAPSSPYGVASGNFRIVSGTYTKGATGTTGTLTIIPGTDDVIYFMYGHILIGATHAGAASPLTAGIMWDAGTTDPMRYDLYDVTADADETFTIPGIGEVPAAGITMGGTYHTLQTAIPSTTVCNYDGGAVALGTGPRYVIEYEIMASGEDWFIALVFFSMLGKAVSVTVGTSDTWA